VGIRKGNLQYYFATRSHLLQAVLAHQIERHKEHWLGVHDRPARDAEERLNRLVAFELAMNRDEKFVAQVRERWSLVERDDGARRLANEWYVWVTGRYARLIGEIRADLAKPVCRRRAIITYAVLVGAAPFCGRGSAVASRRLDEEIAIAIQQIIHAPDGSTP
jgi:AcrR family transcriptional regulator